METANRRMAIQKLSGVPGYMSGGPVKGAGGPTADKVPIMASNGEFVVRAAAVKAIGLPALTALNKLGGDLPKAPNTTDNKFEEGGFINRIPTGGNGGGPTPVDPSIPSASGSELGRNAANTLSALPGAAPVLGAIAGAARATPYVGSAINAIGNIGSGAASTAGVVAKAAAPYAVPGAGAAALYSETSKESSPPVPAATAPLASPNAETMMQRQVGNAGSNIPTPQEQLAAIGTNVGNGITRYDQQGKSPLFSNVADMNNNMALMNRGKPTAQNQLAMDGIQARQDARDSNMLAKMQYDQQVRDAAAINKFQADRGKSVARLAMEGRLAQDIRGDATARYSTDMQRENNQGNLGVSQGRLANETSMSALDMQGKKQVLTAQRNLADAKTPEAQKSAMEMLAGLQGRVPQASQNKYTVVPAGTDEMGNKQDAKVLDNQTGMFITQQQAGANTPAKVPDFNAYKAHVLSKNVGANFTDAQLKAEYKKQFPGAK